MPAPALPPLASTLPLALSRLAIRSIHVLAMAVAVGGAALAWLSLRRVAEGTSRSTTVSPDVAASDAAFDIVATYEWLFWGSLGALVLTGVGNLGSLAPTLPGGQWKAVLDAKLPLVVALLVGSAVRTLLLVRARNGGSVPPALLRRAYAATALVLGAVVALGEVLAHG